MKKVTTVVFLSNYFNHHQKPFSDAMYARLGEGYLFVETEEMSDERKALGYQMEAKPSYVISKEQFEREQSNYLERVLLADVVITGSAPEDLLAERIRQNKLVFRYSERPLKKGLELWKYPYRFLKWHLQNPKKANIYMLCASAYTAGDYAKFGLFQNRCFKWGYFPETKQYDDIRGLIASKKENSLVWVARYIDWKHPEIAVEIAKRLKAEGYAFSLDMIGNGVMLDEIKQRVKEAGLDDVITIHGSMKPEEVRQYMEASQIHIFTSDRNEGWGAVLNESMNSACVPVANREIGSAPYLVEDGKNGYLYATVDALYEKVKYLLDQPQMREQMAQKAYDTITTQWNAENAATSFLKLADAVTNSVNLDVVVVSGPCEKIAGGKHGESFN